MKKVIALLSIPTMFALVVWMFKMMTNPSPEVVSQAGPIIAEVATPWWIPLIQFLLQFGTFGAIIIIALVFWLSKHRGNLF